MAEGQLQLLVIRGSDVIAIVFCSFREDALADRRDVVRTRQDTLAFESAQGKIEEGNRFRTRDDAVEGW